MHTHDGECSLCIIGKLMLAFGPTNSSPMESNTEKEDISSTREGQTLWSFICGVK